MSNTACDNCYHWDSYCISRLIPQINCIWFVENKEVYGYLNAGQAIEEQRCVVVTNERCPIRYV